MMQTALFSARNIIKTFHSDRNGEPFTALDRVNLDIAESRCLMIAGSNGSGKTLLMQIIAGLAEPDSGDILFRGKSLFGAGSAREKRETENAVRRELGFIFQNADAQIVGETVAEDAAFGPENLGYKTDEVNARINTVLDSMGLSGKRDTPARRLSGGEKRRLAVAGVLAMGCNTIIMDEPFANLDWQGIVRTLGIISDLKNQGKTLIILTHELEKALALADRLVILHKGRICDDGPAADVLDRLNPEWGVRDPRRNYVDVKDCSWLEN